MLSPSLFLLAILWQGRSFDFSSIRGSIFGITVYAEGQLRHTGTTVSFNFPLVCSYWFPSWTTFCEPFLYIHFLHTQRDPNYLFCSSGKHLLIKIFFFFWLFLYTQQVSIRAVEDSAVGIAMIIGSQMTVTRDGPCASTLVL